MVAIMLSATSTCLYQLQHPAENAKLKSRTAANGAPLKLVRGTVRRPLRHQVVVPKCAATDDDKNGVSRRQLLTATGMGIVFSSVDLPARADEEVKKVFVAGATGQTGRRVVEQLRAKGIAVRAGVRDIKKAQSLGLGFTRDGAPTVDLVKFDVTGSVEEIAAAIGKYDCKMSDTYNKHWTGSPSHLEITSNIVLTEFASRFFIRRCGCRHLRHWIHTYRWQLGRVEAWKLVARGEGGHHQLGERREEG